MPQVRLPARLRVDSEFSTVLCVRNKSTPNFTLAAIYTPMRAAATIAIITIRPTIGFLIARVVHSFYRNRQSCNCLFRTLSITACVIYFELIQNSLVYPFCAVGALFFELDNQFILSHFARTCNRAVFLHIADHNNIVF